MSVPGRAEIGSMAPKTTWSTDAAFMMGVNVDVAPVPEPANVALGVFAVMGLVIQGGRAWRRHQK